MVQLPQPKSNRVSIQVQSILYNMDESSLERALESLERAIDLSLSTGHCTRVQVSYGDTSSSPCLDEKVLARFQEQFNPTFELSYKFFDKNLGSARGHNELAAAASADFLLILNPDVIVSPRLFENMLFYFENGTAGMVEAKQLPIEHPKDYDSITGETGWATTACALTPTVLFRQLEGFDADSFFLYCDDVDYSWRVREAGYKVIFAPNAVVFHDKRVSHDAAWQPSGAERRYSAEAGLMMAHKWSRPDLVERIAKGFRNSGDEDEKSALSKFEAMKSAGKLPQPRDPNHKVGEFDGWFYTKHRYHL